MQQWAVAIANEVVQASGHEEVQQKLYHALTQCKQHIEARQVRLHSLRVMRILCVLACMQAHRMDDLLSRVSRPCSRGKSQALSQC